MMSIKIIIERKFKKKPVLADCQVINKIRRNAIQQKGYITGETLVNLKDNRVVVLSSWRSNTDWKTWEDSRERAELEHELAHSLKQAAKIKVYNTSAVYKKETFA
ncbi:MAG: hypothetical protein GY857_07995 [Desulfobacula sp.]|nr:hypothetical protein [Desulfobacula sp.]